MTKYHVGLDVEAFGYLPSRGWEMGWRKGRIVYPLTVLPDPDGKIWIIAFPDTITRIAFHVENLRVASE